jgi:pimeloyl-ACP methyl ester carboxylesterase
MRLQERVVRIGVVDAFGRSDAIVGDLRLPDGPQGLVVFAHGSGSSRHSPRNQMVANTLHDRGFGSLLLDLLTLDEETRDLQTREFRFDITLLADRVLSATDEVRLRPDTARLPVGLFGASTGAAAALIAAAERPAGYGAVVSRGGRPDLAGEALEAVRAPTLLLVGGLDDLVIKLNQDAAARLRCEHELSIVPGATHLFEEAGALEEVARRSAGWFALWL